MAASGELNSWSSPKGAIVKRYHYDNHDQLRQHLGDSVTAYKFGRGLKTLKGLIP